MDEDKQEHIQLASIIKDTHAKLRKQFQENAHDIDKVWQDHCSNEELLSKYADAMHCLAVKHWSKLPQTRVDWCVATLMEYYHGGGLKKAIDKEQRRRLFEKKEEELKEGVENLVSPTIPDHVEEIPVQLELRKDERIRVLDVGSCFNPFSSHDRLLSVGIDICPATPNVLKCDFLQLEIEDEFPDDIDNFLANLTGPVTHLPRQCFHSVIFSLLLEYLPSPKQRWLCCEHAWRLLVDGGLLLIVTPDSHKQHRNAHMIKSWKTAIETIGFVRWRYVKLEHLHCLAFRKVRKGCMNVEVTPEMLFIHQDFKTEQEEEDKQIYSAEDEASVAQSFLDLPCFYD